MSFKMVEAKSYIAISYHDLDQLVKETYPNTTYEFIADEEANNDNVYKFDNIDGKLDEWEEEELEKFVKENYSSYITRILLKDMCRKGIIKNGNYLIEVCW